VIRLTQLNFSAAVFLKPPKSRPPARQKFKHSNRPVKHRLNLPQDDDN
jgi:hypothetical protein